jgi:hypothetical protein
MLVSDDTIVGANLAFRSMREIDGRPEQVCNLGALCVLPEHRAHALRLIRAILKTPGITYTDLSPSGNLVAINERLKMSPLEIRTRLLPNLPSVRRKGATVSTNDGDFRRHLTGESLRVYIDHASAPAVRHLLLRADDRSCHVMWRHDRRKRVRAFATILYVSDRDLFRAHASHVLGHLLTRARVPLTLLEDRVATADVPGRYWTVQRPKMFKSSTLQQDQIDYLYSELTQIPW